jgi:hypothetical protein
LLRVFIVALPMSNTINISADLDGMADAAAMLSDVGNMLLASAAPVCGAFCLFVWIGFAVSMVFLISWHVTQVMCGRSAP